MPHRKQFIHFRSVFTAFALLAASLLASAGAEAFPIRTPNVKHMMDTSDAIYRVKVDSVKEQGIYTDPEFKSTVQYPKKIASARVLSVIKGSQQPKNVEIVFPGRPNGQVVMSGPLFASLKSGETYLLFLSGSSSPVKLTDPQTSVLTIPAATPKYAYGNTAQDKMLAEMLAAAGSSENHTRKLAIEQLGHLGDIRAAKFLRSLSRSGDMAEKSAALISRIRIADTPTQQELLSVLRYEAPKGQSRSIIVRAGKEEVYTATSEQRNLITTLEVSLEAPSKHLSRPRKILPGFDYIGFVNEALKTKVIKENGELRSDLICTLRTLQDAKSLPLLLTLLDDPSIKVRYMAATGFAAVTGDNHRFVTTDAFDKDESVYINYWKKWAKEHPEAFKTGKP